MLPYGYCTFSFHDSPSLNLMQGGGGGVGGECVSVHMCVGRCVEDNCSGTL